MKENDYQSWSKDDLIKKIDELDTLLKEMKNDVSLKFSWIGSLGKWFWNMQKNEVFFNPLYYTNLGYIPEEIKEKYPIEHFTKTMHPDDIKEVRKSLEDILNGKSNTYEKEYRVKVKNEDRYLWYFVKGRVTSFSEEGLPMELSGIVFDITSKKNEEEKLKNIIDDFREKALYDPLTKLMNHGSIIEEIRKAVAFLKVDGGTFEKISLLFLDIDDFKSVNDNYGHLSGDSVLKEFSYLLEKNFRKTDIIGRYGGDEFLVLIKHQDIDEPFTIAERMRESIENYIFDGNIRITISGGICTYENENAEEWIKKSDEFMYQAKKSGKNRILRSNDKNNE